MRSVNSYLTDRPILTKGGPPPFDRSVRSVGVGIEVILDASFSSTNRGIKVPSMSNRLSQKDADKNAQDFEIFARYVKSAKENFR
jgi:hypothetical protein